MRFPRFQILPILLLALVLGADGCVQREGGPVRETAQPGETTTPVVHGSMTAEVNGRPWIASGTPSERDMDNVTGDFDPQTGVLTIRGHRLTQHAVEHDNMEDIEITLKGLEPGEYRLEPDFNNYQTATYSKGTDSLQVYFIHEHQSGTAVITRVDTAVHRVFGTFEFTARNGKGHDVKIDAGLFENVKYQ